MPPIDRLDVRAFEIPTATPEEADGSLVWKSTTIVVVEARAAETVGIGYTYTHAAAARLVHGKLRDVVFGMEAMSPPAAWHAMQDAVRNVGRPGLVACAIAAVDNALWDLKARLLEMPLSSLLGKVQEGVTVYGSGGFCNYDERQLVDQLCGWVEQGIGIVKMKVGRDPSSDPRRVRAVRSAVGDDVELFVDANGTYSRKQALQMAARFGDLGVGWLEEPVSSDDLDGLRFVRDHTPPGMNVTAGEYGYDRFYFRRMLEAEAVDVLQVDGTRCMGISGFLRAHALAESWPIPISAHTAPQLHVHPCSALRGIVHLEYFFDHVRIEEMLFDGVVKPKEDGKLHPDTTVPGNGLTLRHADAERYRV